MLSQASQAVTDLVSKLDALKAYEHTTIDIEIPGLTRLSTELEKQLKPLEKVERIWKDLGRDLKEIKKREFELTEQKKKLIKEQKRLNEEIDRDIRNQKIETQEHASRIRRKKELAKELRYTKAALKDFNAEQKSAEALSKRVQIATREYIDKGLGFLAKTALGATTAAFIVLEKSMMGVYNLNEKFRASFAAMAMQIGGASPELGKFQKQSESLYFDAGGLGDLGMGIEQITAEVGSFVSQLGILDKAMTDNTQTLLTHGRVVGLSGAEIGEAAKNFMLMGKTGEDLDGVLAQLNKDAKVLGVSSALLSKNVLVLGKNLLALAGPKFQQQMIKAIEKFTKMGIAVGSMERFTDMTDNFDQAATSMAKLNTVFGTHINALAMFAEQDPAKRFKMITDQMYVQGVQLDSLSRQERKFLADTIGLTVEETNAMLKWAKGGENVEEKLKAAEQQTADWNTGMMELKSTLVTWARIFDKIMKSVMKAAAPLLAAFGIGGDVGNGFMTIGKLAEDFGDKIAKAIEALTKDQKAQDAFKNMATAIKDIGARILAFVGSPAFPQFISDVVTGLTKIVEFMGAFARIIVNNADKILWVFSTLIDNLGIIIGLWAAFKTISIVSAILPALSAISGAVGGLIPMFLTLGGAILTAFWPILAVIAAGAALYGIVKGTQALFGGGEGASDANFAARVQERASSEGLTMSEAEAAVRADDARATSVATAPVPAASPAAGFSSSPAAGTSESAAPAMSVPASAPATSDPGAAHINVQVYLDSEQIQNHMYRRNLRSQ